MADTKISALTDGGIITSADSVPTARSGSNFRVVSPVGFNVVQTPDTILFTTDPLANSIIICEKADEGFDFAHALATNPTLFIHSAAQNVNQYISFAHNGANAVINPGLGNITLGGVASYVSGDGSTSGFYLGNGTSAGRSAFVQTSTQAGSTLAIPAVSLGTGNYFLLVEKADIAFDFAHAAQTNPTLFIHSAAQSTTQWLGLSHNASNASYTRGVGSHLFDAPVVVAAAQYFGTVNSGSGAIVFYPENATLTPDGGFLATGTSSNSIHIAENADTLFDFNNGPGGVAACTDPTLIIHSHNQTTTQWLAFAHNATDGVIDVGTGGIDYTGVTGTYKYDRTITAGGTTGAQVINKTSGTVNFAAAATTLVVTNSLVNTSSIVFAVVRTADATATIKSVVPAAGSFTITLGAAATAETSVGFFVTN